MSYTAIPRSEMDRQRWDAFVAGTAEGWAWHLWPICQGLSLWPRHVDASFCVVDSDRKISAVVPLQIVKGRRIPGFGTVSHLLSAGGPALARVDNRHRGRELAEFITQTIDSVMAAHRSVWAYGRLAAMTPSLVAAPGWAPNPLVEFGFADRSESTWIVDLRASEDVIRSRYSQLTRRELKKATDKPHRIREARGPRDLETYYALHSETCRRTGILPHPFDYFRVYFEDLSPRNIARILFYETGGEVIAAQNTVVWKGGAIYTTGASRTDRSGGENRALFDDQIRWCRANGCAFYETGQAFPSASDEKERGLSQFKSSFGTVLARQPAGRRLASAWVPRILAAIRDARATVRGLSP